MSLKSVSPDSRPDSQTVQQLVDYIQGVGPHQQITIEKYPYRAVDYVNINEATTRAAADTLGLRAAKAMDDYYKKVLYTGNWDNVPRYETTFKVEPTKGTPMTNRTFYSILIVDKQTDLFDIQSVVAENDDEARIEAFRAFDPTGVKKLRSYDVVVLASKPLSARKTKDA